MATKRTTITGVEIRNAILDGLSFRSKGLPLESLSEYLSKEWNINASNEEVAVVINELIVYKNIVIRAFVEKSGGLAAFIFRS